jgi:hypothetical protein
LVIILFSGDIRGYDMQECLAMRAGRQPVHIYLVEQCPKLRFLLYNCGGPTYPMRTVLFISSI